MITETVQRHYQGEAGRHYQEEKRGIPECAVPWVARLRAEKISPSVRPSDVVLEYGVGQGWNLAGLQCKRKIGFDVAEFLEAGLSALGIEFISDTKVIADGTVDVAVCHHTLEHVAEPAGVLREIRRMLPPGGKLLLFVPLEEELKFEQFDPDEPNHHLFSWNTQSLGNLVRETGFQVEQAGMGEFGYSRFAAVWAVKLHLGETGFRALRRMLLILRPIREVRIVAVKSSSS